MSIVVITGNKDRRVLSRSCEVNAGPITLVTESMSIQYSASPEFAALCKAVTRRLCDGGKRVRIDALAALYAGRRLKVLRKIFKTYSVSQEPDVAMVPISSLEVGQNGQRKMLISRVEH